MSNAEFHSDDLTILATLEALDRLTSFAAASAPSAGEISESDTLARLYTEVLGLVPFELEPVQPAPEVRARLMSLIQETPAAPRPVAVASPVPVIAAAPAAPAPGPAPAVVRGAARSVPARSASRWPLALAATLAFLMLGLSAWLYFQVGEQRQTIAHLEDQLAAERNRVAEVEAESRRVQAASLDSREALELVTSYAVEVSPMRPVGEAPLQPGARGILYVRSDHQHWYMALDGLAPAQSGQAYKLWFLADSGAVSAGSFTAEPGAPIVLTSKHMPAGTRGVLVTLETDARAPEPTGPEILRAAPPIQVS